MTITESINGTNAISFVEDVGIVAQQQNLSVSMVMTGAEAGCRT